MPWKKKSKEIRDLKFAESVLEADHYGLEKIKERILEFLAVRRLVKNPKGSILCFVGPPGVGKTSLGMSIAKATGRKFVRMSLGGVRDEAEIRGHRRTYIGALPGQIIQMMKKAGTRNPVFMLDEVDKMSMDFRGDPSRRAARSARPRTELHVRGSLPGRGVRPQPGLLHRHRQRAAHHSGGAAGPHGSDPPLRLYRAREDGDRQALPGHASRWKPTGLDDEQIEFTDDGINSLIQYYTREAGVRNLEREIGNVCRKIARQVVNSRERQGQEEADKAVINGEKVAGTARPLEVPRPGQPRRRTKSAPPPASPGPKSAARSSPSNAP